MDYIAGPGGHAGQGPQPQVNQDQQPNGELFQIQNYGQAAAPVPNDNYQQYNNMNPFNAAAQFVGPAPVIQDAANAQPQQQAHQQAMAINQFNVQAFDHNNGGQANFAGHHPAHFPGGGYHANNNDNFMGHPIHLIPQHPHLNHDQPMLLYQAPGAPHPAGYMNHYQGQFHNHGPPQPIVPDMAFNPEQVPALDNPDDQQAPAAAVPAPPVPHQHANHPAVLQLHQITRATPRAIVEQVIREAAAILHADHTKGCGKDGCDRRA